uniref:Uncharacterized protein n=1 Tax=Oryza brachyantha TaxID=4533 RepID=J3MAZ6_ORYBR
MRDPLAVTDAADGGHHGRRVLLQAVCHGHVGLRRVTPVVVNAEASTNVDDTHGGAQAGELAVDLRGLADAIGEQAGGRDLGANVEVQELEAVEHTKGLELGDDGENLRGVQAELALLPRRGAEVAGVLGAQLSAHADHRAHAEAAAGLDDNVELLLLLEHDDRVEPHGARDERERDVLVVLVAVADEQGVRVAARGEAAHREQQLRLGAGLQAEAERLAELHNVLHDVPVLVALDGVHALVPPAVAGGAHGVVERRVEGFHAVAEHVWEPHQE